MLDVLPVGRSFFSSSVSSWSDRSAPSLPFLTFLATTLTACDVRAVFKAVAHLALGGLELVARVEAAVVGVLEVVSKVTRQPDLLNRADGPERLLERDLGQDGVRQAGDEDRAGLQVTRHGLGQQPVVAQLDKVLGLAVDEGEDPD